MKNESDPTEAVNFPPLPWLGARLKWHVLEKDGSKVLANRLDNILFQRTMNFFGASDMSDYVLEGDVMTDGNRRIMSTVGFVNQRYLVTLVGNAQILEVSSNHDRLKQSVKFPVKPNTWYRLKTHVKAKPDGSGTVFAKAWPRGTEEPAAWTIETSRSSTCIPAVLPPSSRFHRNPRNASTSTTSKSPKPSDAPDRPLRPITTTTTIFEINLTTQP